MEGTSSTLKRIFKQIIRIYNNIEITFMVAFTMIVGFFIMFDIVTRFFGLQGLKWIEETGRMMLVTTTVLGCSIAVKNNGHAVMDTLYNIMPNWLCYVFRMIVDAMCGVGFIYISFFAGQWCAKLFQMKRTMESVSSVPLGLFWIVITIGFFSMGVRYLIQLVQLIGKLKRGEKFNEIELQEM